MKAYVHKKAILTIEASLVLPLFLMLMVTLMSLILVFYSGMKMEICINEEAKC